MASMTTTFYANKSNEINIVCPQCGKVKTVHVTTIPRTGKELKIKCSCGHIFPAIIDGRRFFRKKVKLAGKLIDRYTISSPDCITVENISYYGITMTTRRKNHYKVGDILHVTFLLDNAQHTEISKTIIVKHVREQVIGAEFVQPDAPNAALGFYLMPD
jgi:hypothetical protein